MNLFSNRSNAARGAKRKGYSENDFTVEPSLLNPGKFEICALTHRINPFQDFMSKAELAAEAVRLAPAAPTAPARVTTETAEINGEQIVVNPKQPKSRKAKADKPVKGKKATVSNKAIAEVRAIVGEKSVKNSRKKVALKPAKLTRLIGFKKGGAPIEEPFILDIHTTARAAADVLKRKGDAEIGLQIEKGRQSRNGITRPSTTTIKGNLWSMYDLMADTPVEGVSGIKVVTIRAALAAAAAYGLHPTTATIQFYRWRQFNGQRGRVNLKKAQAKPKGSKAKKAAK